MTDSPCLSSTLFSPLPLSHYLSHTLPLSLPDRPSTRTSSSALFSVLGTMTPRDSFFVPLKLHHSAVPPRSRYLSRAMEKACQLIVKRRERQRQPSRKERSTDGSFDLRAKPAGDFVKEKIFGRTTGRTRAS